MKTIAFLLALLVTGCATPQTAATPTPTPNLATLPPPPTPTTSPIVTASQAPRGFAPLLEFTSPGTLSGDWVLTMSGGIEAGGGRSTPFAAELWAAPLAAGGAVRIARFLDRYEGGRFNANDVRRQISADGRRVVVSAGSGPRYQLALLDLAHGTVTAIRQDDADLLRPALSPDGTRIAFVRQPTAGPEDGLWIVNADGSGARRLRPGVEGLFTWIFGWTSDSRQVAFDQVQNIPSYVLVDVATGAVSAAIGFLPLYVGDQVDWRNASPRFVAGFADRAYDGEYRIVVADRADGPQRVVVSESNHFLMVGAPRWHPMRDEILYRRLIRFDQVEFYVASGAGGQPTEVRLAERPYIADWTPDGNSIVYLSRDPGGGSIYGVSVRVAARAGSADRELFAVPSGGLTDLITLRYSP